MIGRKASSIPQDDSNLHKGLLEKTNDLYGGLKGEELLDYIKNHRDQLEDNGDSLCIGAGYGTYNEDGSTICRLDLFSTELIKARKASHLTNKVRKARQEILDSYDLETLRTIAESGCVSGKAHSHLQILDNEKFYDENRSEISCLLEDQFGKDYIMHSAERAGGVNSHWKHRAVWRFIEMIANEEIERLTNNHT